MTSAIGPNVDSTVPYSKVIAGQRDLVERNTGA
jgi:hypothetical protein